MRGVVRVCVTYTVAGYFLPPHYARFARAYPDIKVELTELPRPAIEQGLKDDAFDLAVMLVSNLQDRDDLGVSRRCSARAGGFGCRWSIRCFRPKASRSPTSRGCLTSC